MPCGGIRRHRYRLYKPCGRVCLYGAVRLCALVFRAVFPRSRLTDCRHSGGNTPCRDRTFAHSRNAVRMRGRALPSVHACGQGGSARMRMRAYVRLRIYHKLVFAGRGACRRARCNHMYMLHTCRHSLRKVAESIVRRADRAHFPCRHGGKQRARARGRKAVQNERGVPRSGERLQGYGRRRRRSGSKAARCRRT